MGRWFLIWESPTALSEPGSFAAVRMEESLSVVAQEEQTRVGETSALAGRVPGRSQNM